MNVEKWQIDAITAMLMNRNFHDIIETYCENDTDPDIQKTRRWKGAEILCVKIFSDICLKAELAKNGQRGFDVKAETMFISKELRIQVKQRSIKGWKLDNLKPPLFDEGLVDLYFLVLTDDSGKAVEVWIAPAYKIFDPSNGLFYNKHNDRYELTHTNFRMIATRIQQ